MKNTYVAIMAGGIGSRFWPKSRISNPKQFLDVLGTGQSLIQMTFERFRRFLPAEQILVVTNEMYTGACQEHLPEIPADNILVEPLRRNTAPCVAYVAWKVAQKNPYANLIIAPSDHLILYPDKFIETLEKGLEFTAGADTLLTLGIRPTRPDTGYGYIQYHEEVIQEDIFRVKTFTEKPNKEIAEHFIKSGDYLWNAGVFLWNVQSVIKSFEQYSPEISSLFEQGKNVYNTPEEADFIEDIYPQCPNVSIDVAIMEKAQNVYVLPSSFGWSDLGTWTSVWDKAEKDEHNNKVLGDDVMVFDSKNSLVIGESGKLVIVQGMEDCCVVDTPDALLVCKLHNESTLKKIHGDIKHLKGEQFL